MGEIFERVVPPVPLEWTGERLTTAAAGQVEIEHLHRYCLARTLCRGLDVLDVASGEGYGTALLAQTARSVVGVELAPDAVAHAAGAYAAPNLRFLQGDARRLPLSDAAVDIVVSFETIEHFYEHEAFLAEARRVLRPGGQLVISSPERDIYSPPGGPANPFHVRELTRDEFVRLLQGSFAHVAVLAQRPFLGSALVAETPAPAGRGMLTFERRGANRFEVSEGLPRPIYLVAVASDVPVGDVPDSLFLETSAIGELLELRAGLRARALGGDPAAQSAPEPELIALRAQCDLLRTALRRRMVPLQTEIEHWRDRHDELHAKLQTLYGQAVDVRDHNGQLLAALQDAQARLAEEQARFAEIQARLDEAQARLAEEQSRSAEAQARLAEARADAAAAQARAAADMAAARADAAGWQQQYQALRRRWDSAFDRFGLRYAARLVPASGRRFIRQRLWGPGPGP